MDVAQMSRLTASDDQSAGFTAKRVVTRTDLFLPLQQVEIAHARYVPWYGCRRVRSSQIQVGQQDVASIADTLRRGDLPCRDPCPLGLVRLGALHPPASTSTRPRSRLSDEVLLA